MSNFKRGAIHSLAIFAVIFAIISILILPTRRYLYMSLQHFGLALGQNFNNISTEQYVEWIKSQVDDLESNNQATFLNNEVKFEDRVVAQNTLVLGESTVNEKWILVDISDQKLYMKEGDNTVGEFLVSTGKWAPTPIGQWRIWTKLRYTRMRGGSKALGTFYDLPNVPYTMYYYQGYGIHGAYWHNNFGQPMSHGCVNMNPEEAGVVFNWASVGTKVVVQE